MELKEEGITHIERKRCSARAAAIVRFAGTRL